MILRCVLVEAVFIFIQVIPVWFVRGFILLTNPYISMLVAPCTIPQSWVRLKLYNYCVKKETSGWVVRMQIKGNQ